MRMRAWRGDITKLADDAIVNAANEALIPGGGVDGAIHDAAGPDLLPALRLLNRCAIGDAKATDAFNLRARHIIHAVGPVWIDGLRGEPDALASAYRRALEIAGGLGDRTIAFPAISTGAFGFPPDRAAAIAVAVLRSADPSAIDEIVLVASTRTLTTSTCVGWSMSADQRWRPDPRCSLVSAGDA